MKILSYNVNGIRAAFKKDIIGFLQKENPDIVCFQEIKALQSDIDEASLINLGYECHWFSAEKKGYSGVGIISKLKPKSITTGMGDAFFDGEGRTIIASYDDFTLVNTYFPSGTSGEERQAQKYIFLDKYFDFIAELRNTNPNLIVVGDYNIAHTEIDLHSPKTNQKTSGFLLPEREWMTKWFASGMVDSLRHIYPERLHAYSWWTARFPSMRAENKGWRIDYISVSETIKDKLKDALILKEDIQSDHCAIGIILG